MRFEKDHDPDPLRDKYAAFQGISNLPEEIAEMMEASYAKITSAASEYEEKNKDAHGLVAYMAIQDVQITALQKEIKVIYTTILELAKRIDDEHS
tara:strand:- start:623 stop:907 length:285 start_codon:yes stop_codon:yes gene_type:complete